MSALLTLLESLDEGYWPWLLLGVPVLLSAYFFASASFLKRSRESFMTSSNLQKTSMLETVQQLHTDWSARKDYTTVLRGGPTRTGAFKGWFPDEVDICTEFRARIGNIGEAVEPFPRVQEEYLRIVDELQRKPKPWWAWVLLVAMMAAEAYGFSLLLAGYLNDQGSAAQDARLGLGLSVLFAVAFLFAAYRVGRGMYLQAYAYRVWKACNGQIRREIDGTNHHARPTPESLDLNEPHNRCDQNQAQPVRMANRSSYVATVASGTVALAGRGRADPVRRYTVGFWIYVAVVAIFGIAILNFRLAAIDDSHGRELARAQELSSAAVTLAPTGGVRPAQEAAANADADAAVTQSSLDKTRQTKQIVTVIYVLLFWGVQAIAVLMTQMFDFASDKGRDAWKAIHQFRRRHGRAQEHEYDEAVKVGLVRAGRDAEGLAVKTLKDWQTGLLAAYHGELVPLTAAEREAVEQAIDAAPERTFERFLRLKETQELQDAWKPEVEPPGATPPQAAVAQDELVHVEYYARSTSGGETLLTATLADLQRLLLTGEVSSSELMVRDAGQPGRFASYRDWLGLRQVAGGV